MRCKVSGVASLSDRRAPTPEIALCFCLLNSGACSMVRRSKFLGGSLLGPRRVYALVVAVYLGWSSYAVAAQVIEPTPAIQEQIAAAAAADSETEFEQAVDELKKLAPDND